MAPPSETLFPEPGGSPEDQQRLLELLVARLGPENVLQAAPLADYRPELANLWEPVKPAARRDGARDKRGAAPAAQESAAPGLPRPAWLLAKPLPLLVRQHRPFYGSPLKLVSAPERIEAGWWSQTETRDYFIAEGLDHAHYWVYRERMGAGGQAEPRWYLHGLFG